MTPDEDIAENEQHLLTYYYEKFIEEIKIRSEFYNKTAWMVLTIPLFVNAGAAISLASFYSKPNPEQAITFAACTFILGTILGILTLIFEFFSAYFARSEFNKYLRSFNIKAEKGQKEILKELQLHYNNNHTAIRNEHKVIQLKVFNGVCSIFFCFLGIYFIAGYLLKSYCIPSIVFILLILYTSGSLIWIKSKFNSKK